MATYLIVGTVVDDRVVYENDKLQGNPLVEQYGGEYLARGGALLVKESDLWSPTRMVVVRFPDTAMAEAFYNSPQYQAILPISKESARRTLVMLEGV